MTHESWQPMKFRPRRPMTHESKGPPPHLKSGGILNHPPFLWGDSRKKSPHFRKNGDKMGGLMVGKGGGYCKMGGFFSERKINIPFLKSRMGGFLQKWGDSCKNRGILETPQTCFSRKGDPASRHCASPKSEPLGKSEPIVYQVQPYVFVPGKKRNKAK